jgi:hypothetical protein
MFLKSFFRRNVSEIGVVCFTIHSKTQLLNREIEREHGVVCLPGDDALVHRSSRFSEKAKKVVMCRDARDPGSKFPLNGQSTGARFRPNCPIHGHPFLEPGSQLALTVRPADAAPRQLPPHHVTTIPEHCSRQYPAASEKYAHIFYS